MVEKDEGDRGERDRKRREAGERRNVGKDSSG